MIVTDGTSSWHPAVTVVRCGTWRTNCYIVRAPRSDDALVIDPGDDPSSVLEALGDSRVRAVICTHGHYDHIGAAAAICDELELPLLVDERDRVLLERAPLYALSFERRQLSLPRRLEALRTPAALAVGDLSMRLVHAPGHTPGSILLDLDGVTFSGDTLLRQAVGRTDLPGGDARALRASVDGFLGSRNDQVRIFPGHGPAWTVGEARRWWGSIAGTGATL